MTILSTPYIIQLSQSSEALEHHPNPPSFPPPTPINGLIAQAMNLTADNCSSLSHNHFEQSQIKQAHSIHPSIHPSASSSNA
ncbi:Hypothetical predicted protein, partial [Prunus dulcis]